MDVMVFKNGHKHLVIGCVVAGRHADHTHNPHARDIEESKGGGDPQRPPDLVPAHQRAAGDGQRMVHVPDQHRSHEVTAGIFRYCW